VGWGSLADSKIHQLGMDGYVLLRKSTVTITSLDQRLIRSKLVEAGDKHSVEIDQQSLSGESADTIFDLYYNWQIKSIDDGYQIEERQYIQKTWFYSFWLAIFFTSIGLSMVFYFSLVDIPVVSQIHSVRLYLSFGNFSQYFLLSSGWFLLVSLSARIAYSPIISSLRNVSTSFDSSSPLDIVLYTFVLDAVVGFIGYFTEVLILVGFSAIVLLLLSGIVAVDKSMLTSYSDRLRASNPIFRLPTVIGEYLLVVIPSMVLLVAVLLIYEWVRNAPLLLNIGLLVFPVFSLVLLRWVSQVVTGSTVLQAFYDVKQDIGRGKRRGDWKLFVWTVITSYTLFILLGVVISRMRPVIFQPLAYPVLSAATVGAVLPAAYFVIGLVYQTACGVKRKYDIFTEAKGFDTVFDISSATILRTGEVLDSPASLSTGFNDYIFIPDSVAERIDRDELDAIIVHEEAHIQKRESLVFMLMPIISLILLTGQNVVYMMFDFRQRELEADRYAAERVGNEAVISALNKMSTIYSPEETASWWQEQFGMFYGTFTRSQAHPSVDERIEHLEK